MEQKIWKNVFDQLKLTEERKERAWEEIVRKSDGNQRGAGRLNQRRRGRVWLGRCAVVCSLLLGIVLIHIQTEGKILKAVQKIWKVDQPTKEIVDQTINFQHVSGFSSPELAGCSEERLLIASAMGLVVYDREQKRVVGTIDLKSIGCFYVANDLAADSVKTRILPEDDRLTIFNQPSEGRDWGECYIFNLAECQSAKKGEVKALKPEKKTSVTASMKKRWNKYAKKIESIYFDHEMFVKFQQEMSRKVMGRDVMFTDKVISWRDDGGARLYSGLAVTVPADEEEGTFILYNKNRDTGKMEKEVLELRTDIPAEKEERLPAYQREEKDPIRKALADCAREDIRRYLGGYYKGYRRFRLKNIYPEGIPVLPVIRIYAVKEGKKYTKVYGEFTTLGLVRSGDVLREYDPPLFLGDGCAYLKKTGEGYVVEKILHPRDGEYIVSDMLDMCDGDEKLYKKVTKAHNDYGHEELKMVEEYVAATGLSVKYFKKSDLNLMKIGTP